MGGQTPGDHYRFRTSLNRAGYTTARREAVRKGGLFVSPNALGTSIFRSVYLMQVLIANPTLLHRKFSYRLPGNQNTRHVPVNAGGQSKLPDDLSGNDLDSVIAQIVAIGGVPASEVSAINLPKSFIFDVRKNPIDVDKIEEGLERDETARQDVSGQMLEEAGLGAFKLAEDLLKTSGAPGRVVETTLEIVETTDRGKTKDGVNAEFVVSTKPNRRAGRKRTEKKA
jgi:hypothetical protein